VISIHLRRAGATKDPHYRVVVADSRKARDGAFIEILGHYHPRFEPAKVVLDVDKAKAWIAKGAQPSDTVKSLMRKVESGIVEVERPASPSRHRDANKHAVIRAAAPKPEPEVEAAPVAASADAAADVEEAAAEGDGEKTAKAAEEDKE
jgi:small subunit ribosomal protein S16